jgi:TPP-dependent pyruvate/acetoin dehydrogenase alpha subunit
VDGNDVLAVDEVAGELLGRVRAGEGPQFLWVRTHRLAGHTAADPATYRSAQEVAERWRHDPIARCRTLLMESGMAEAEIESARVGAEAEIERAVAAAEAAPWPDAAGAFGDVQDLGTPQRSAIGG